MMWQARLRGGDAQEFQLCAVPSESSLERRLLRACSGADLRERDRAADALLGAGGYKHVPGGGEAKHIVDQQTGEARRDLPGWPVWGESSDAELFVPRR